MVEWRMGAVRRAVNRCCRPTRSIPTIRVPEDTLVIARCLATVALLALVAPAPAHAQDAERSAVLATVQKVFDAMRTRDTALLKQAFDSSGRLVGVSTRNGPPTV